MYKKNPNQYCIWEFNELRTNSKKTKHVKGKSIEQLTTLKQSTFELLYKIMNNGT